MSTGGPTDRDGWRISVFWSIWRARYEIVEIIECVATRLAARC
jgi:hypothetical protein